MFSLYVYYLKNGISSNERDCYSFTSSDFNSLREKLHSAFKDINHVFDSGCIFFEGNMIYVLSSNGESFFDERFFEIES